MYFFNEIFKINFFLLNFINLNSNIVKIINKGKKNQIIKFIY